MRKLHDHWPCPKQHLQWARRYAVCAVDKSLFYLLTYLLYMGVACTESGGRAEHNVEDQWLEREAGHVGDAGGASWERVHGVWMASQCGRCRHQRRSDTLRQGDHQQDVPCTVCGRRRRPASVHRRAPAVHRDRDDRWLPRQPTHWRRRPTHRWAALLHWQGRQHSSLLVIILLYIISCCSSSYIKWCSFWLKSSSCYIKKARHTVYDFIRFLQFISFYYWIRTYICSVVISY